jgi:hypothetical protein
VISGQWLAICCRRRSSERRISGEYGWYCGLKFAPKTGGTHVFARIGKIPKGLDVLKVRIYRGLGTYYDYYSRPLAGLKAISETSTGLLLISIVRFFDLIIANRERRV